MNGRLRATNIHLEGRMLVSRGQNLDQAAKEAVRFVTSPKLYRFQWAEGPYKAPFVCMILD